MQSQPAEGEGIFKGCKMAGLLPGALESEGVHGGGGRDGECDSW